MGTGDNTKEVSVNFSQYGKYSEKVSLSSVTPLGLCSVVYKEILPRGRQKDPANLLKKRCFSSGLSGGRTLLQWNAPEDKFMRW